MSNLMQRLMKKQVCVLKNGIHTIKAENLENGMGTMILLLIGIVMEKICVMTEKLYSEIDHFISSHVLVGRL